MRLSSTARTRLKNLFIKVGLILEVEEDGRLFYYESEDHKANIIATKARG